MATVYVKLNTGISFGPFAAGSTFIGDSTSDQVIQLLNADLATLIANPGGSLLTHTPNGPAVAIGAQATAAALVAGSTDEAGQVTATALASAMAAGVIATVSFLKVKTAAPKAVILTDQSAVANGLYVSAKSTTGFTISSRSAATASQALKVDYHVL
jgi:hypothetical protein